MSWLRCNDCDRYFNAKEELDWKDRDGRISCEHCIEDEEALTMAEAEALDEPVGPDNYLDDEEALASAGMGMDESYGYNGEE